MIYDTLKLGKIFGFTFLLVIISFGSTIEAFGQTNRPIQVRKKKKKSYASSNNNYGYQDLTSRNNYFFNAKLILTESIQKLQDANEDDFQSILGVYDYTGGESASTVHTDMDVVLKKATNDLSLHENSKWADNEYVLIGQAYYLKGDFTSAFDAFNYVQSKFKNRIRVAQKGSSKQKAKVNSPSSKSSGSKAKSGSGSSKTRAKSPQDVRARQVAKLKAKKEKEKLKKKRAKDLAKRNKNRAKLKKINAKRKKKGQKRLTYEEKFGESESKKDKKEDEEEKEEIAEEVEEEEPVIEEEPEPVEEVATLEDEIPEEEKFDAGDNSKYSGGGLFSHKLSKYDAAIWESRARIENGDFAEAIGILNDLKDDSGLPKKKVGEMYKMFAHYYLTKEEYNTALGALDEAIENIRGKRKKGRLHFIKGQIYDMQNNPSAAAEAYKDCIKSKPTYLMEFNARISLALSNLSSGTFSAEDTDRYFEKMEKDEKNADYLDQLYFARAKLALKNGDIEGALALLKQAANAGSGNDTQQAQTFLTIAELLYDNERYAQSGLYYDSALTSLSKDYKDYEEISSRRDLLKELVDHLNTIQHQDSLLTLANLPEKERNRRLDKYIRDFESKVQDALAEKESNDEVNTDNTFVQPNNSNAGSWYFYNSVQRTKGFNEFQNRMGARVLEDNWRRKSKASGATASRDSDEGVAENDLFELAESGELSRDMFLRNLPLDPADQKKANGKIQTAMFGAGTIYREGLESNPKAKEHFESLITRYPGNSYEEQTLYTLYLICKEDGNPGCTASYKDMLFNKYSDGLYSNLIKDPGYAQKMNKSDSEQTQFYERTYLLYEEEKYDEVLKRKVKAENLYASSNNYQPQFDLLEAFVIGHTREKQDYINALKGVVTKHTDDPVKDKAEEILKYLQGGGNTESAYKYKDSKSVVHYFIISLGEFTTSVDQLKAAFSDFNSTGTQGRLKVTQMLLDKEQQIVLVKNFLNDQKVMEYYDSVKENEKTLFAALGDVSFKYFAVSKTNFTTFFKSKDIDSYYDYFSKNYLEL